MSIKIGINGSTSFKNVNDVIVGTSKTAKKDVNLVKDWNGKIIWQRITDIPMKPSNTIITIDPTSYSWSDSSYSKSYTAQPSVTSVKVNGVLLSTSQYDIAYSANSTGTLYGTSSVTASVTVSGKNGYSGDVSKNYNISHAYNPPRDSYTIAFNGNGNDSGSMTPQYPYRDEDVVLRANSFGKTYCTFSGWGTSSGGPVVYADKETVRNLAAANQTATLYAIWNDTRPSISLTAVIASYTNTNCHVRFYMDPSDATGRRTHGGSTWYDIDNGAQVYFGRPGTGAEKTLACTIQTTATKTGYKDSARTFYLYTEGSGSSTVWTIE